MSQDLIVLLKGLTDTDTSVRSQYEKQYQEFKQAQADVLAESLAISLSNDNSVLQQFAGVLLRRCLEDESATGAWQKLTPERRKKLRQDVLASLNVANVRLARKAITHVIAQISRLCFTANPNSAQVQTEWPELFRVMFETSQSPDPEKRESGFEMFAAVAEYAPRAVAPHSLLIGEVLGKGLKDPDSVDVRLASLKALGSLMVSLQIEDLAPFRPAVPMMLDTLRSALDQAALTNDERLETASRGAIKALIDVVTEHPKFLQPDFEMLAQSMIAIASAEKLDSMTRCLGLEFLVASCSSMPSFIRKEHPNLASEMIPLSMRLMCEKCEPNPDMAVWELHLDAEAEGADEDGDELFDNAEAAIHRLASALGGKTVIPKVFALVPNLLADQDWRRRRTALQTLSLMAEGCGKRIYSKLGELVKWAAVAERDPHPKVRYASVHLLGRLALDFSDEERCGEGKPSYQKKYVSQVLPLLGRYLRDNSARVATHAASALVNFFVEFDLTGSDVAPFLDSLLEGLMMQVTNGAITTKDEALAAISAISIISGPELFARYYDHLMPLALNVASNTSFAPSEKVSSLRGRALECAGLMAAAVGPEKFAPHAQVTLELVLRACHQKEDFTLRNNAVAASVRVAKALGEDFVRFLPDIIPDLIHGCKEESGLELIDEELAEDMQKQGFQVVQFHVRGEGTKTVKVNSAAVQEISTCVFALYNFALQFGQKFAQFAPAVFGAILPLLDADALQAVRNIAIVSLPHIVNCVTHQPPIASDLFMVSFFALLAKLKNEEDTIVGERDEAELESSLETMCHLAESLVSVLQGCYESNGAKDNDPYLEKRVTNHPPQYGFATPQRLEEGLAQCAEALQRRVEILIEHRALFEEEKADHDEGSYEKFLQMDEKLYELAERMVDANGYLVKLCAANPQVGVPLLRQHLIPTVMLLSVDEARDDIKRLGLCLVEDLVEFLPALPEEAPVRLRCVKVCLETAQSEDNALARAAVWGLGVLAVYGGPDLDEIVMEGVRVLAATIEHKHAKLIALQGKEDDPEANDDVFMLGLVVDNALSALEKFCRHRGEAMKKRGLEPESVLQKVIQLLPCSADAEEAKVVNVQMAKYAGTPIFPKEDYLRMLIAQLRLGYDQANVQWDEDDAFLDIRTRLELARGIARGEHQIPSRLTPEELAMVAELGRWFAKKESQKQ